VRGEHRNNDLIFSITIETQRLPVVKTFEEYDPRECGPFQMPGCILFLCMSKAEDSSYLHDRKKNSIPRLDIKTVPSSFASWQHSPHIELALPIIAFLCAPLQAVSRGPAQSAPSPVSSSVLGPYPVLVPGPARSYQSSRRSNFSHFRRY
jgi:hypothetical protein